MNSMNMLKVTVAFLAGLVIALGGALIYVRSSEPSRVAQVTPATPQEPRQPPCRRKPPQSAHTGSRCNASAPSTRGCYSGRCGTGKNSRNGTASATRARA